MPDPVRIAFLSFAHMHAGAYAEALAGRDDARIAAIWDDDGARGAEMASRLGAAFFPDIEKLLDEPLDAIIVTSENSRHRPLVETICRSRNGVRAILCEKPLSTNRADGQAMIDCAASAGKRLATAFPCRYSPAFRRAFDAIRAGNIGKVLAICGTNHGVCPMGWFVEADKSGGGAIIDHTVHVADLNRLLLGQEAVEVYAELGNRMYHQSWEDTGFLTVTYSGGAFATIDTSWSRPPKSFKTWGDVTLEIVGEGGTINVDMFAQAFTSYDEASGKNRSIGWGSNIDAGLMDDFLKAARGELPELLATGEDGLRASEVAFAAYELTRSHLPQRVD